MAGRPMRSAARAACEGARCVAPVCVAFDMHPDYDARQVLACTVAGAPRVQLATQLGVPTLCVAKHLLTVGRESDRVTADLGSVLDPGPTSLQLRCKPSPLSC